QDRARRTRPLERGLAVSYAEPHAATQVDSVVLVTRFEGYGGRSVNARELVAKRLAGTEIAGVRVSGHTLPVNYVELGPRITALIEELRPRAVICLGLWPGTPLLRIERVAVNIADFEIPDNVGHMTRGPVVEGGPEAYRSTLP